MVPVARRVIARSVAFVFEQIEKRLLMASIGGTVFGDFDADGAHDANEPGLAGWTVYIDTNDNSAIDGAELTRLTDGDGNYSFDGLAAGSYNIREILPAGWQQTVPNSGGINLRPAGGGDTTEPKAIIDPTRPFTQTEVVARVDDLRGLRRLDRHLASNPQSRLAQLLDLSASRQMFKLDGGSLVEVHLRAGAGPVEAIGELSKLGFVDWATPNYIYEGDPREFTPNDPQYASQYHHPLMKDNLAWDTTLGDPKIIIGITDDGQDVEHQDLYLNVWVNQSEIPATRLPNLTDINGDGYISMEELNDAVNKGPFKANDVNSDGHISSADLLAAMVKDGSGNDTGTGGWTDGVDEGANGYVDDIAGRDFWQTPSGDNFVQHTGSDTHGSHVMGIAAARTNNGVGVSGTAGRSTVIPIKFYGSSGNTWTSTIISNAYRYGVDNGARIISTSYNVDSFTNDATFRSALNYIWTHGVLHFNSAGNNNQLNSARQSLDTSLFVVNTNSTDTRSSNSNYGWGVDISAPGSSILSTFPNNTYGLNSGTSMATPNAAGVAALIWSAHPNWTREQVAAQLLGTADDIDSVNPSFAGLLGRGRVNANRAINETLAPPRFRNTTLTGLPAEGASTSTSPTSFTFDVFNVFDPATMNASNFEIRGDGLDDTFGTADDSLVPFTLTFGGAQFPDYRVGTNRLNFTITGNLGADRFRFSALPTLTDPFGTPLDGNGDGTGGDAFTRTFNIINRTNRYRVTVAAAQAVTTVDFGNRETTRPSVTGAAFLFEGTHVVRFAFSEDVGSSVVGGDLVLTNLTTSQVIPPGDLAVVYLPPQNRAVFTYTGTTNGALPDGNYTAVLPQANVADNYGNALDGPGEVDFFVFSGDANRDRTVDITDFSILASNFNQAATYSFGDFNYNGTVEIGDFSILASKFNTSLPAARTAAQAAPTSPPAMKDVRIFAERASSGLPILDEHDAILADGLL